jgi:cytoskeletal protein RodZ
LREFFTAKQLKEVDLYIDDLDLTPEEAAWIKQSRQSVEKAEKKKRKELLFTRLALAIAIVFLFFAGWQYFEANKAKKQAERAEQEAIEAKNEAITQKMNAEKELNNRKMLEIKDLDKRAGNIENAGGNPRDILIQMEAIISTHPDSSELKRIIQKYK